MFFLTTCHSDELQYKFYPCQNYIDLYLVTINKIGFILFSDIQKMYYN